jgi:ribosomal protein L39E
MGARKFLKFKKRLSKALLKRKRPPIWVVMKTKERELMRRRKRQWRFEKLHLRTKHKKKQEKLEKHKYRKKKEYRK